MPILLLGMNHVSAPLKVRERATFPPDEMAAAVVRLARVEPVDEGLILSTCNRTEILVNARAPAADAVLRHYLAEERRVTEEELDRHCYLHADQNAVRHVFRVASSLDSMILGEAQILGQVKEAYATAVQARTLGPVLDNLMQRAGEAGVQELVIGMAHRGRLNVLVNTLGKIPADLFSEFEGKHAHELSSGDVKYHQGFSSDIKTPGGTV
ncbi:MAG TPA: hypothetical protein VFT43_13030, partial [Candidatus Polarisedimenticolia bacterium]|nr:hypothetical protein [Candidatus Polarisedimenticolia bacterium]